MTAPRAPLTLPDSAAPVVQPEIGQPGNLEPFLWNQTGGKYETGYYHSTPVDPNPDLRFPESVAIYDQMVRTDPQVGAIYRLVTLYLRRANWTLLDGKKQPVRQEVVDRVRVEIGLAAEGETDLPSADVVFRDHLNEAVRSFQYGFAVFEKVYEPAKDGSGGFHLRKLATRPQRTIRDFKLLADGELVAVIQNRLMRVPPQIPLNAIAVELEAPWLLVYSHDKEGADWSGTSILRHAYKPWLLKDMLLRAGGQGVERGSMGIPFVEYDENRMTARAAEDMVRNLRAGSTAGAWAPMGAAKLSLLGVTGSIIDPMPWVKLCNEEIAMAVLAMFITLGHDSGARALATTFVDAFTASLQALADFIADAFTRQVIRDIVAINFGPDEPCPRLSPGDLAGDKIVTATDMQALAAAHLLVPDDTLEAYFRRINGLPEKDPTTSYEPPPPAAPPYDGVDPNLPPEQRINQPHTPNPTRYEDIPVAGAAYLEGLLHRLEQVTGH